MENDTTTQPAEQERTTRITTVSVKVKREVDLGYLPFLRYMKKNQYKQPPFGMRDASRASFEMYLSAEVGDDISVDELAAQLAQQGHAIADRELRKEYPESFPKASAPAETPVIPDESFVIATTEVERKVEEY